jgi:hypothetical protein
MQQLLMQQLLMQQLLMQQLLMQQLQQETKPLQATRLVLRVAALLMLPLQQEQLQLAGQWLVRVRDQVAALQGQEVQHLVNRGLTISTIDKKLSVCIHSLNFFALCVYDSKVSTSSSPFSVARILEDMRNFSEFLHYEIPA